MTRQEVNIQILGLIAEAITKYPDRRFGQILSNIQVVCQQEFDFYTSIEYIDFYEESDITLKRMIEMSVIVNGGPNDKK